MLGSIPFSLRSASIVSFRLASGVVDPSADGPDGEPFAVSSLSHAAPRRTKSATQQVDNRAWDFMGRHRTWQGIGTQGHFCAGRALPKCPAATRLEPPMRQPVTESIERLRPYVGGKPIEELARERGLTDIIKLASNESALGPSPLAVLAAQGALSQAHRYPDGAGFRLRGTIAEAHGVTTQEVIHGNGSNEILELAVRTFTTPEEHIIFGTPGFSMYPVIAAAHNAKYTAVPTTADLRHDLPAMLSAVRTNTKLIVVDNPNNPTGTYVARETVEEFLRAVPEEVIVVMDEAYFEFADAVDYPDSLKLRHLRERLIVLRTFSKAYGLAGFRVGFGIGPADLIAYLNRLRAPFNVGVVSQEAAISALGDTEHLQKVVRLNNTERVRLSLALEAPGRRVYPSQANFILVDFHTPAAALYDELLSQGVIVRPIWGLPTHLRITIGTPSENDRLLLALEKVLS